MSIQAVRDEFASVGANLGQGQPHAGGNLRQHALSALLRHGAAHHMDNGICIWANLHWHRSQPTDPYSTTSATPDTDTDSDYLPTQCAGWGRPHAKLVFPAFPPIQWIKLKVWGAIAGQCGVSVCAAAAISRVKYSASASSKCPSSLICYTHQGRCDFSAAARFQPRLCSLFGSGKGR